MSEVHEQAAAIEEWVTDNEAATVQEIAAQFELEVDEVIGILDTHFVTEDGIEYRGEGLGGNWAPARAADRIRNKQVVEVIDSQIAERQELLANLRDDADPAIREALQNMIGELEARRADHAEE